MTSGIVYMPSLPPPRTLRFTLTSPHRKPSLYDVKPPALSSRDKQKPKLLKNLVTQEQVNDIVSRLTRPTLASKLKSSRLNPSVNYVDMNSYRWNRMALYEDYQRHVFGPSGTVKSTFRKCVGHQGQGQGQGHGQRRVMVNYSSFA